MLMFNTSGPSGRRYKDVDCVTDMGTPLYEKYTNQLQAEVNYSDQANYGKYTVYFGISLIFLAVVETFMVSHSRSTQASWNRFKLLFGLC